MIEGKDASREQKEELKPAVTYIDLTRHGNRFGGKIKIDSDARTYEFDDLESITPEGKESSRSFGLTYPVEVTLVHPKGGMARHGETGEDILGGSKKFGNREEAAPVMAGGKVKGTRKAVGTDYKESGMDLDFLKRIKGLIGVKLQEIFNHLSLEEQEQFIKPENAALRAKYREQAQVFGLGEAMKDDEAVKIAAENEALALLHSIELSRRGVKSGEVKAIPIVGSGMFAESLFKHALVIEDLETSEKKVGFNDLAEIGGITKQATAFRIKASRNSNLDVPSNDLGRIEEDTDFEYEFTDPERAKLFEGKKVYLDWDKVRQLALSAGDRLYKN